ncbi:hypothetical protein HMPREF9982_03481, partial [Staphylococcus epidermidis NIHLM021]
LLSITIKIAMKKSIVIDFFIANLSMFFIIYLVTFKFKIYCP